MTDERDAEMVFNIKRSKVKVYNKPQMGGAEPPKTTEPIPLRVLLLGSSPFDVGLGRIRADREFRAIQDAAAEPVLRVVARSAATADDLEFVLAEPRPDVLHLCCHGNSATIMFSTPSGAPHPVPVDSIVARLESYRDNADLQLRAIVLAMCHSADVAPRFAPFADTVVAWEGEFADECGIRFAAEIYRAAARGYASTIGRAARLAAAEVGRYDPSSV